MKFSQKEITENYRLKLMTSLRMSLTLR